MTPRALILAATLLAVPLANAAQLVVGQVTPLSGLDATQGRAYAAGMRLLFDSVSKSAPNGHTFTLVSKDDGGRPDDTVTATRQLLEQERPLVLAGYFGARSVSQLASSGMLEKERIALVGYRATEIRAETPLVYNVRAGLREEIAELTEHLGTIGITRVGLFYEDTPGAPAVLAATEELAKKARGSITVRATYPAGTSNVSAAVDVFVKTPPQAILMVASGAAAAGFIEQYRAAGGTAQLFAHSGADIEQLSKRLSEVQMQGVAIAQVTPSPYKISSRLARELGELVAKNPPDVPVSYAMMEGFIAAKVIVEAVRRQGARPSREGMAAALDAMNNVDLGGHVVSYKPGSRTGSRHVELSIISGAGRIRQ